MRPVLVLVFVLLAASLGGGQEQQRTAGQSSKTASGQKKAKGDLQFMCPDPMASEACKSFLELRKAGDESVRPVFTESIAYVCFRPEHDEFFIFELAAPVFFKIHLDPKTHKQVPDDDATSFGAGRINAFSKGIEDYAILPIFHFQGKWTNPPNRYLQRRP